MMILDKRLGKTKAIEIEVDGDKEWYSYFEFSMSWDRNLDHAGFRLTCGIWRYTFYFCIYDTRHWNDDTNSWEVYK